LVRTPDSEPSPFRGARLGDGATVEDNGAAVARYVTRKDAEQCRLTGAVGTDQSNDRSRGHRKTYPVGNNQTVDVLTISLASSNVEALSIAVKMP